MNEISDLFTFPRVFDGKCFRLKTSLLQFMLSISADIVRTLSFEVNSCVQCVATLVNLFVFVVALPYEAGNVMCLEVKGHSDIFHKHDETNNGRIHSQLNQGRPSLISLSHTHTH